MDEKLIKEIVEKVVKKINNNKEINFYKQNLIPILVSNRHIHLSEKDFYILFGKDYKLQKLKDLGQPGQFACKETITIATNSAFIEKVRILGPFRNQTQVEISKTDAYKLKINPPIRDSGDLKNSEGIILIGPKGVIQLKEGVIIAKRHIHLTPEDAKKFNVKDKEIVKVKVNGQRGLIFDEVLIRVSNKYALEMHIDTDEANAANIKGKTYGELIK